MQFKSRPRAWKREIRYKLVWIAIANNDVPRTKDWNRHRGFTLRDLGTRDSSSSFHGPPLNSHDRPDFLKSINTRHSQTKYICHPQDYWRVFTMFIQLSVIESQNQTQHVDILARSGATIRKRCVGCSHFFSTVQTIKIPEILMGCTMMPIYSIQLGSLYKVRYTRGAWSERIITLSCRKKLGMCRRPSYWFILNFFIKRVSIKRAFFYM